MACTHVLRVEEVVMDQRTARPLDRAPRHHHHVLSPLLHHFIHCLHHGTLCLCLASDAKEKARVPIMEQQCRNPLCQSWRNFQYRFNQAAALPSLMMFCTQNLRSAFQIQFQPHLKMWSSGLHSASKRSATSAHLALLQLVKAFCGRASKKDLREGNPRKLSTSTQRCGMCRWRMIRSVMSMLTDLQ